MIYYDLLRYLIFFAERLPNDQLIITYGFVGDSINMEEYGSIGFGPVSSSSSCLLSSDVWVSILPSLLEKTRRRSPLCASPSVLRFTFF